MAVRCNNALSRCMVWPSFLQLCQVADSLTQAVVWTVRCVCIVIIADFSYEFDANECSCTKWCNFLGIGYSD